MDSKHIERNQVVDRYLMGQLNSEGVAAFEERLLWDSEVQEELVLCQKLRQGVKDAGTATVPKADAAREFEPLVTWILEIFRSPAYAVVASVLVLVLAGLLLFPRQFAIPPSSFSSTQLITLLSTRGALDVLVEAVTGASAHELTLLTVDAGPEPYDNYRLTVYREADDGKLTEVVRQDGLQPDYAGTLVIGFPGSQLTPGNYLARAEGWKTEWPADRDYDFLSEIPFRVTAGP